MTTIPTVQTTDTPLSRESGALHHTNLITDTLLARALQTLLQITNTQGQMRARELKEKGGFTMCETAQLLQYLFRDGILQADVDGLRVVDLVQVQQYVSILLPEEDAPAQPSADSVSPFPQEQVSWGCFIAHQGKLTPTRLARPSGKTRDMATALGLLDSDKESTTLFPPSHAQALCTLIEAMTEQDRAASLQWAERHLQRGDTQQESSSQETKSAQSVAPKQKALVE